MSQSKDSNGDYFVQYILNQPPAKVDPTVWSVAVTDYFERHGVPMANVTAHTTASKVDFAEIRRIYNRLLDDGKQRRSINSTPVPGVLKVNALKKEES